MAKNIKRKTIKKNIECPNCSLEARIEIKKYCKYIIYVCPKCKCNIVYYGYEKVNIISDKMVEKLKKQNRLEVCGDALFPIIKKEKGKITKDQIIDLKITLETEQDVEEFLKKI